MYAMLLLSFFMMQNDPILDVEITKEYTKESLLDLKKSAKQSGVDFNILYDSYDEDGKIKTLQVEVQYGDKFKGKSTLNFKSSNDCLRIIVDVSENAPKPFFLGKCED
jgi:hypothetical protein